MRLKREIYIFYLSSPNNGTSSFFFGYFFPSTFFTSPAPRRKCNFRIYRKIYNSSKTFAEREKLNLRKLNERTWQLKNKNSATRAIEIHCKAVFKTRNKIFAPRPLKIRFCENWILLSARAHNRVSWGLYCEIRFLTQRKLGSDFPYPCFACFSHRTACMHVYTCYKSVDPEKSGEGKAYLTFDEFSFAESLQRNGATGNYSR